jgi:hypothetical protein
LPGGRMLSPGGRRSWCGACILQPVRRLRAAVHFVYCGNSRTASSTCDTICSTSGWNIS